MKNIQDFQEWFRASSDADGNWRNKARENFRFYVGKQWDSRDLEVLAREKRPALTINKVFPIMNFLLGYQIQNRQDISVVNRKGATKLEAEILTECIKHIMDTNEGEEEVSSMFFDGIITGRGFLSGRVDFTEDPIYGDILLERFNPLMIYPDPRSIKYDLSDAEFICKTVWQTLDQVKASFPEKADDIGLARIERDKIIFSAGEEKYYEKSNGYIGSLQYSQVLVEEYWYKTYKPVYFLILENNLLRFYSREEVQEYINNLYASGYTVSDNQVIERILPVLNLATIVGDVILQDTEKPLGEFNSFPIIPFFPYKIDRDEEITDDCTLGVIDNIKDIQREINKRRSQQLHIVNTLAHSGWLNPKIGGADKKQLERFGSTPGIVIDYENVPPSQITPKPISQAHLISEEKASTDLREITGVNPDLLGYRGERGEPGVVIQMRQQQGSVVIAGIMGNLRRTKKLLGKTLIGLITQSGLYTPEEIINIIDLGEDPQARQLKIETVNNLLNNPQVKKFDVVISSQANSPTQRIYNFYVLTELMRSGFPIPPDILLKASDIPYKEELLNKMKQIQQQAPQQGGISQPQITDVSGQSAPEI